MPGYKNRFFRLEFPELTEEGEPLVYLKLRNPTTRPYEELQPDTVFNADGSPVDRRDALHAMYAVYAALIVAGHVYDATVSRDDDGEEGEEGEMPDQPLLTFPMSADDFAKLPSEIQNKVADEVVKRQNPTTTPAT